MEKRDINKILIHGNKTKLETPPYFNEDLTGLNEEGKKHYGELKKKAELAANPIKPNGKTITNIPLR